MALVARVKAALGLPWRLRFDRPQRAQFSDPIFPIDQLLLYAESRANRTTREDALSVPSVLRGRNLICSISTLPLEAIDASNRVQDHPLLAQIDPNVPNVVTLAMTIEDLLLSSVSWWRITAFDHDGMPYSAVRYAPDQVSMQPPPGYGHGYLPSGLPTEPADDLGPKPGRYVWMGGEPVPFDEVMRFDSPNPGLLECGSKAICRALALDAAAELYAGNPQARGFFTPTDPATDPGDDAKIIAALDAWQTARQERLDGYVPAALKYNPVNNPTPVELQLVEMKRQANLDIANEMGLDPEDLGLSTTSRTYQNATDRRKDRINDTYAPYMRAITDRLSMPDVTKTGERVRWSLDDYLKADPKTRAEVQQIYHTIGVTDSQEIRHEEGLPPRAITLPAAPRPIPATVGDPVTVAAASRPQLTFARETGLTFDLETEASFSIDTQARTITGLAVPWGQAARSGGRRWRFARGSIKYSAVNRIKLLRDHDNAQAIGKAIRVEDTDAGLMITFAVSPGARGDEALALALDGVLDGLSIGVEFRDTDFGPDPGRPGDNLVFSSALREVSLTAVPSFDDSRLTSVRAARSHEGDIMHECEHCHAQLTPGVAHTCQTPPAATPPTATPTPAAAPAAPAVTFTAEMAAQFAAFLDNQPAADPAPTPVRPVVDPTRTPLPAVTQVEEALPYRFSYTEGRHVFSSHADHDFSSDLFAMMDTRTTAENRVAAGQRVNALIQAQFAAVDQAGTTDSTRPHRYRPDMWQAQMDYATPLWEMVAAGDTDGTKFDIPKFSSSSGLVGPATEGTEPAPGAFAATLQTITPTQVWGKVNITRQAWRAGGNPALSGILWDQMLREYYEDREAAVATFLATLTAAADITLTGTPAATPDNDDDQVTVGDFAKAIADLGFVRGGNRFRAFAVHQDLYRVFSRVTDDAGRPLYPIINPQNANGTSQPLFSYMDVNGVRLVGSWALGAAGQTTATNSWLFDPAKVLGWASAPERLFWDFGSLIAVDGNAGSVNLPQLKEVTLGIYGDVAFGNTDIAGVRQVIFDPSV